MQNQSLLLTLCVACLISCSALADTAEKTSAFKLKNITVGLGHWVEFLGDIQKDENGETNKELLGSFQTFTPYLNFGMEYNFHTSHYLIPEFAYVLPRQAGDKRITKNLYVLRADYGYQALSKLRLRTGISWMALNTSGEGGEEEMNNGNSTSTYYVPNESKFSTNFTWDLGLELTMPTFSLRWNTYIYGLLSKTERTWSHSFSINFLIPKDKL